MAALCLLAARAEAHAPPEVASIAVDESGRAAIYASNRGLIVAQSDAPGGRLLCNEALGLGAAEAAQVAYLGEKHWLVASTAGLLETQDGGCAFAEIAGYEGIIASALAQGKEDRQQVVVAVYHEQGSELIASWDAGTSWGQLWTSDPSDYLTSLALASPLDVYATGTHFEADGEQSFFLLRSNDGGGSWEREVLPGLESDYQLELLTVSSLEPEVVVLGSIALNPGVDDGRLLLSRDAGRSFIETFQKRDIVGASFEPGGGLWVAARSGLFYAANPDAGEFSRATEASQLGCVELLSEGLLACGHYRGVEAGVPGVGRLDEASGEFALQLRFDEVKEPVECGSASETAARCEQPWQEWVNEVLASTSQPELASPPPAASEGGELAGDGQDDGAAAHQESGSGRASPLGPEPERRAEASGCGVVGEGAASAPSRRGHRWAWVALGLGWLLMRRYRSEER